MNGIDVQTSSIVKKLTKNVKFLQPLYEAIINSLEANATDIEVIFSKDIGAIDDKYCKINGFTIIDNGDGFTEKNRKAFCELWTENKVSLGCKGSGRFTWLGVYENITITSYVVEENKKIFIPFDISFGKDDIQLYDMNVSVNRTQIEFKDVTKKYYNLHASNGNVIDHRVVADISKLKEMIEEYLIMRLFLLKNLGKNFNIKLVLDDQEKIINNDSIPDLKKEEFIITSDIDSNSYKFDLYYKFVEDRQNSKVVSYCADNRPINNIDGDKLGFSSALPNRDSFHMLLCSEYFDGKDDDARSAMIGLSHNKNANFETPLLESDIKPYLLKCISKIIHERYPEINDLNMKAECDAIESAPYLAKYIKGVSDIVKNKTTLTEKASDAFNEAKIKVRQKFEKLLVSKDIDTREFTMAVQELSDIASAELGEYILYRDNIIKALDNALNDVDKNEDFIHEIFMPKKSVAETSIDKDYLLSNMWLLDDKFMTFSSAFSDVEFKKIAKEVFVNNTIYDENKVIDGKRPDLAVFYNKHISRDALLVEFKGLNVPSNQKESSIIEIKRNCYALRRKINDVGFLWAYIITKIDDSMKVSLASDNFKQIYTNADEGTVWHLYIEASNAHIFAVDIRTITSDAFARNKTFLDILKHK